MLGPLPARGGRTPGPSQPPRRLPCGPTRWRPSSSGPRATRSSSRRSPASPWAPGRSAELPESVHAAMSTQIDQLAPPVRRVLRYCAVLGRSFRREVLERILAVRRARPSTPRPSRPLSAFIEADGEGRVRFRNSLVRDAAYEGLAFRVRARIHRTAGAGARGRQHRPRRRLPHPRAALRAGGRRATHLATTRRWPASWPGGHTPTPTPPTTSRPRSRRAVGCRSVTDADRARLWTFVGELRELAGMFEASVDAYRRAARLLRDDPVDDSRRARRARRPCTTAHGRVHHGAARGRAGARAAR